MASELSMLKWVYDESDDEYEYDSAENKESDVLISLHGLNLGPMKKLLVICLNGLLAHNVHNFAKVKIPANRLADGVADNKSGEFLRTNRGQVFKRPYCDEFLKFCFETFEVGIWSSASRRNVDDVVPLIFGAFEHKLRFTWNQSQCTRTSLISLEKKKKPVFFKELKKIWNCQPRFTSSNTLLIDGFPYRALLNLPHTAIFPYKYTVNLVEDDFLGPKGELRAYLEGLAAADDVPTYVKANHLGQDAMTPNHPDWDYYLKVMRGFPRGLSNLF